MKTKSGKAINKLRSEYKFDYLKAVHGKYYKSMIGKSADVALQETNVAKKT